MNIFARIHWVRVLTGGVLAEVFVFAIVIPIFLLYGQPAASYAAPPASMVTCFLCALWVGRRVDTRLVLHGTLVGVVATLLYIGLTPGRPEPQAYLVAHVLKILGGAAGGFVAGRPRRTMATGAESETYYEELSPCLYFSHFDPLGKKFKAVGWLALGHPYRQGAVPKGKFHQLLKLLEKPWLPGSFMGYHECEFCPKEAQTIVTDEQVKFVRTDTSRRAPSEVEIAQFRTSGTDASHRRRLERGGLVVWFGSSNLFVPADGIIYVAPSMIVHYIDEHGYDPPSSFWEAVLHCPETDTTAYRRAMIANGPSSESWLRAVHWEGKVVD